MRIERHSDRQQELWYEEHNHCGNRTHDLEQSSRQSQAYWLAAKGDQAEDAIHTPLQTVWD